jgi:hypothetical protein
MNFLQKGMKRLKRRRLRADLPFGRDEGAMKQAARDLARAGGFRYRHYVVKVDSGRAACIEEFDPPGHIKTRVD